MTDPLLLVRTRLLSLAPVTTLVGQRVYTGLLPQTVTYPAVALKLAGNDEPGQLRGSGGLIDATVQVHAVGRTRDQAVDVADAIDGDGAGSGLSFFRGVVAGTRVLAITPEPLEREDYRADDLKEWEVMRAYRVQFER